MPVLDENQGRQASSAATIADTETCMTRSTPPLDTVTPKPAMTRQALLSVSLALAAAGAGAQTPTAPPPERTAQLVRMVRQDCGSCHGMQLTGGLGPALTRQALAAKPPEYLAAVIIHGIPGTPMPPWSAMLSESEAQWIAAQLANGFPEEERK